MPNGNNQTQIADSELDQVKRGFQPAAPQQPAPAASAAPAPSDPGSVEAIKRGFTPQPGQPGPKPIWSGSILPVSQYPGEPPRLDLGAGIIGGVRSVLGSAATAGSIPGDVMTGKLQYGSPEFTARMTNAALLATPGAPGIAARAAVPGAAELKAIAQGQYRAADALGVQMNTQPTIGMANNIIQTLRAESRYVPNDPTFSLLRDFTKRSANAASVPYADLTAMRSRLSELSAGADESQAATAKRALGFVDNYLENPPMGSVAQGDALGAAKLVQTARQNYGASARSRALTTTEAAAEQQARPTADALRGYLRTLSDPRHPERLSGFSDAEKQAIQGFISGSKTQSALGTAGKIFSAGHSPWWAILAEQAAQHSGASLPEIAGTVAAPLVIGKGADAARDALARRAFQHVDELVRSRSPEYASRTANEPRGFGQGPLRPWERNVGFGALRTLGAESPSPAGLGAVAPPPRPPAVPGTPPTQLFD